MSEDLKKKHAEMVNDAALELKSDPEKYNKWQHDFVSSIAANFKSGDQQYLSAKQRSKLEEILKE